MKTLVYKRTHNGDPNELGVFGCNDCMGSVRSWSYEAVIGIGGLGQEAENWCNAGKLNWIGIGPHKNPPDGRRPQITFDHFKDFGTQGDDLRTVAPLLAKSMYDGGIRAAMSFRSGVQKEIEKILAMAENEPASLALVAPTIAIKKQICRPKLVASCNTCECSRRRVASEKSLKPRKDGTR